MASVDFRTRRRAPAVRWLAALVGVALFLSALWLGARDALPSIVVEALESVGLSAGSGSGLGTGPAAATPPASSGGGSGANHGGYSDETGPQRAIGEHGAPTRDERAAASSAALRTEPLEVWLGRLARSAERALVVDPRLQGEEVTAAGLEGDWRESLEALSRTVGFEFAVGDRFIEVRSSKEPWPPQPSSPREDASRVAPSRPIPSPPSPVVRVVQVGGGRAEDIAAALDRSVRSLGVAVQADAVTGKLVVSGLPEAVERAAAVVGELDLPPRSFLLEAEIVELSETARLELGAQWSVAGRIGAEVDLPGADAPGEAAGVLLATSGEHAISARLGALEADGLARVVSRPRVVVLEGTPATVESVRVLRVRLPDRSALIGGEDGLTVASTGSRAVEEIPVGITLNVSPRALDDGRVLLAIKAKSSTLGPPQPPDGIPEEFSRLIEAEIVVADGATAVLGGLLREGSSRSASGVPGLRAIPVLGHLFGKRRRESETEELVFLVTPTLVR